MSEENQRRIIPSGRDAHSDSDSSSLSEGDSDSTADGGFNSVDNLDIITSLRFHDRIHRRGFNRHEGSPSRPDFLYLPLDAWYKIIEFVVAGTDTNLMLRTLARCARVCWTLNGIVTPHLQYDYRCRRAVARSDRTSSSTVVSFRLRGYIPPLSQFLLELQSLPHFHRVEIDSLDLSIEHPSILRITPSFFITALSLTRCATQSARQLGCFVTLFPKLVLLNIQSWSPTLPELKRSRIHRVSGSSSLQELRLRLIPNIWGLLDYFIVAGSFSTHLTSLSLFWTYDEHIEQNASLTYGISELLQHCSQHLQDLTMLIRDVGLDPIPDRILHLISMSPLTNLETVRYYNQSSGPIARFALDHLQTMPIENKLSAIEIWQKSTYNQCREIRLLDDLLAGGQFQSLRRLGGNPSIADRFPKLAACGVEVGHGK